MGVQRVVWIDCCRVPREHGPFADARRCSDVLRVTLPDAIAAAVRGHRARLACVEYDYPDRTRLRLVTLIRREFPALPLLMLTEYHSEALAVWAFRSRVWDYRVKPIESQTLAALFDAMARATVSAADRGRVAAPMPRDLIAPAGHLRRPLVASSCTAPAIAYISEHYAQACRLGTLAGLCHLSGSEFSRAFHREQGVTFRRFLLQYRVARARDFLTGPDVSVSEVAYGVGFNDLSHFGRVFRRLVGVPATVYQRNLQRPAESADE